MSPAEIIFTVEEVAPQLHRRASGRAFLWVYLPWQDDVAKVPGLHQVLRAFAPPGAQVSTVKPESDTWYEVRGFADADMAKDYADAVAYDLQLRAAARKNPWNRSK
jgi:hypothetical protein